MNKEQNMTPAPTGRVFLLVFLGVLSLLPIRAASECLEGDCVNGTGTAIFHDGRRYTGSFRFGRMDGEGVLVHENGNRLSGLFNKGIFIDGYITPAGGTSRRLSLDALKTDPSYEPPNIVVEPDLPSPSSAAKTPEAAEPLPSAVAPPSPPADSPATGQTATADKTELPAPASQKANSAAIVGQEEKPATSSVPGAIPGKFPQAASRLLNAADLAGFSASDLKLIRNEIFARHSYIFKNSRIQSYFADQQWYTPKYTEVFSRLTETEKANIELIRQVENTRK